MNLLYLLHALWRKKLAVCCLLIMAFQSLQGQTTLFTEDFTYANGTTTGSGAPAKWTINAGSYTPTTFSVQSNVFTTTNSGGEVVWTSKVIPISGWLYIDPTVYLPSVSNMESTDYINVYYSLDGGPLTLFTTNGSNTGNYSNKTASVSPSLAGATLKIVIKAKSNASNETHYIDNVSVSGDNNIYFENFSSYSNGTNTSSLWSISGSGSTFSVQGGKFDGSNISPEVVWQTSVISISSFPSVNLSVLVEADNKVSGGDYVHVYYKLNGGAETLFATNGNNSGNFGTLTATQTGLSGTTVQIIIRAKNNRNVEDYYWDDITVTAIFNSPALQLSATQTMVSCNGLSDGSIDLTVTSGVTPYTYSWTGGATSQDISGKAAGTYTVTVTGFDGASATKSVNLAQAAVIIPNATGTNRSCLTVSDGSIDLEPTGGNSPYSFDWGGGITTEDRSALASGTFTVTITDANGCTVSSTTVLSNPAALSASIAGTNILCYGNATGAANLTASGGTAPLTYLWSNSATTEDISALAAGTYTVTVTANGNSSCTVTDNVTLTQPAAALSGSITGTNRSCLAVNDGTADLTPSGGTSPYTYAWNGGATTQDRSSLASGSYTVTITDASSCTATANTTLTDPAALSASIAGTNIACYGGSTGAADLTASGGTGSKTYLWSNSATTEDISNLASGTYTVTVTVNGNSSCTVSASKTLTQPAAALSGLIVKTDISCIGASDGAADLTPSGGTSPYTYAWNGGATSQDLTGIGAGSYTVTITDASGCTATASTTLSNPAALSASISGTNITNCYGSLTGAANLTASGGNGSRTYVWSNSATTEDLSNIGAGSYTVTVTTNGNAFCTVTANVTVTEPAQIVVTETISHISCHDVNDGSITISAAGGNGTKTYAWAGGSTATTRSPLAAGNYSYTVTDANSCTVTNTIAIINPAALATSFSVTNQTDELNPDGAIDQTVSGGWTPYTYLWNDKSPTVTTEDRTNVASDWYSVTVTDARGCKVQKATLLVWNDTIRAGSFIVNMGVSPQTVNNGLKPYGLIYDMIRNYQIPVKWIINPSKSKDGIDFSYNGVDYKGGTFILDKENIDAVIKNRISYWQTKGVVGNYSVSDIAVPVYTTLKGFSNVVVDQSHSNKVTPYFTNALIPTAMFRKGQPSSLTNCDDGYILPFGSTSWSKEGALRAFVNAGGFVYASGSSAPSLENLFNPGDNTQKTNFLTTAGLSGGGSSSPFTYNPLYDTHPLMQFMGDMTGATGTGSTKGFIPKSGSAWYDGTFRAVTSSSGTVPQEGVKMVFGNGYDDKDAGIVMYLPGNDIDHGATADKVAAQRAFFNFILQGSKDRRLLAIATVPNSMMEGTNVAVSVSVTNGTPPYTYKWTTNVNGTFASGTADSTTFTLNNGNGLPWARVSVKVTDACGKVFFDTKNISVLYIAGTIVSNYNGYGVTCNGSTDGFINLDVQGGSPPFTYLWSVGDTTQDLWDIAAGFYTVTITDALSTTTSESFDLIEPPPLIASLSGDTMLVCYDDSNGTINLTRSGGVAPYSYLWSGSQITQNISDAWADTFTIAVTDTNGCYVESAPHIVAQPDSFGVTTTANDVSCNGGADGSISLTAFGGNGSYSYTWSTGASAQSIAGLSPGIFVATATDANGCSTPIDTLAITEPDSLSASSVTLNASCAGNDGSIDLTPSGGTSPYTYSWSSGQTTQDLSGRTGGSYTVTVTDANSCTLTHTKILTQPAQINVSLNVTDLACYGDTNGVVIINISNGTGPFDLYDSEGLLGSLNGSDTLDNLPGFASSFTVTDAAGCNSDSFIIAITEPGLLTNSFTVSDVTVHGGADGSISQTVSGGTTPYLFDWSNGNTTKDISGLLTGVYSVTITDYNGCTFDDSAYVNEPGACPCTWLGLSTDWHDGNNWDCGFEPTDTCEVIIPAGTSAVCQIYGSNAACHDLTIQANATLNIAAALQLDVNGDLTNDGLFVRNNSVVRFTGSAEQHIYGSKQINFWNIHILNTSGTGVRLHKSIAVYGDMRLLDGYVFTGADTVKMESDNQGYLLVYNPNSFIVGKLCRKIENNGNNGYEFPVGDAGMPGRFFRASIKTHKLKGTQYLTVWFGPLVNYDDSQLESAYVSPPQDIATYYPDTVGKVVISNGDTTVTSYTAATGYTATAYVTNHYNLSEAVEDDGIMYTHLCPEGIWHLEPDRQPDGGFYDLIISTINLSGLSDNNFGVLKRPSGTDGRYWCHGKGGLKPFNGEGRKVSDGYAMRTMLTSFSEGGGGSGGGGGLPIELLDFNAELNGDQVDLTWGTATETNNDYFTVEKSDGNEFRQVALIAGAGNSSVTKYYSNTDYQPFKGVSYYRLKQTDYDGKFEYSEIVSVKYNPAFSTAEENEVIIFPNPSTGEFALVLKKAAEVVHVIIFDAKGNHVRAFDYSAPENNFTFNVSLTDLKEGIYYLKVELGARIIYTKKLLLFSNQ